jgi:hypothetical protein
MTINIELEKTGRKGLWANLRYYLHYLLGGTERNHEGPQKSSFRIADIPTKIRTGHLQKTNQKRFS